MQGRPSGEGEPWARKRMHQQEFAAAITTTTGHSGPSGSHSHSRCNPSLDPPVLWPLGQPTLSLSLLDGQWTLAGGAVSATQSGVAGSIECEVNGYWSKMALPPPWWARPPPHATAASEWWWWWWWHLLAPSPR